LFIPVRNPSLICMTGGLSEQEWDEGVMFHLLFAVDDILKHYGKVNMAE
jgi:hypothetical protein